MKGWRQVRTAVTAYTAVGSSPSGATKILDELWVTR